MSKKFGTLEVKMQRGKMVVNGLASTPRGTKFIAGQEPIETTGPRDPKFKEEMATAVAKLFGETV